jgi:hypothetical protein
MYFILKILRPVKHFIVNKIISLVIFISKNRLKYDDDIKQNGSSILFNTQYHWYHSWVDYTLAAALEYRGYKVKMLLCDGMPYCEQETLTVARPACSSCYKNTKSKAQLFGLDTIKLSQLISESEKDKYSNLSTKLSVETLMRYQYLKVNIGIIAFRNFTHYYKGFFKIERDKDLIFRKCIESALLLCKATNNYLSKNKVDKIITPNGKFIQSGIAVELAKLNHINFYSWDVFAQNGAAIFSKNNVSHDQKIDDIWDDIKHTPLNDKQSNEVDIFYDLQSKSLSTPYRYYDDKVIEDTEEIKSKLFLRKRSKVITLFTNVEWDSTAMGQDLAYTDMFHWVKSMIELTIQNQDIDLIIRAHPGEMKVPKDLQTRSCVCDRVLNEFHTLPTNVKLIQPENNVSSYALSSISNIVMVYTSTLGLEFALMGIKPWLAATPYYSGKGFTIDITSHEQLVKMVEDLKMHDKLNEKEVEFAKRLAYVIKFRRLFHYPVFNKKGKFQLFDYNIVGPGNGKDGAVIQNVCDFIEDKRSCLDLGPAAVNV